MGEPPYLGLPMGRWQLSCIALPIYLRSPPSVLRGVTHSKHCLTLLAVERLWPGGLGV